MKKILLLSASFLMLLIFGGASVEPAWILTSAANSSIPKDKNVHKEFKVEKGKLLDLDFKTGASINVEGWDRDIVSIDAELGGRDWEDIYIDFDQNSNGVSVTSGYEGRHHNRSAKIDFTIKVPNKFDLKFNTMGGAVKLKNMDGDLKGTTMGGELELTKLKGYVSLKTMGGPVNLTDSDVDGNVSTMGGKVNIENVTGNVDGKSMGGNVTIKNLKRRDGGYVGKEVHISTMGGGIELNTAPFGADVNTMGGNITINSVDKFVKAKTMGGKIYIGSVNGSVKATTMGGDVNVTETGTGNDKDIDLKSMSGDITLVLPENFSMNIEANITYDKDDSGEYKIYSDFNLNESKKTKDGGWFDNDNEILTGTGSFNGGQNTVRISTVVGNIYIKKAK